MDETIPQFRIAEKFYALQGEGFWTGTPMFFIRFTGCTVGKAICHHCDTDFDNTLPWMGGGVFSAQDLSGWGYLVQPDCQRICFTGGEPLNQPDLEYLFQHLKGCNHFHLETSGTVPIPTWVTNRLYNEPHHSMWYSRYVYVCVSPKPGFIEEEVLKANEIKVIVNGLGNGGGWPTPADAKRWADAGKQVFLQPRNKKMEIDVHALKLAEELVLANPNFRLSTQLHKALSSR